VFLGTSHETSAFAVSCLRKWWQIEGRKRYPQSGHILILADTGGSNGAQRGTWKQEIQRQLCDGLELSVTVSPFLATLPMPPNGISSSIVCSASRNWAADPLDSYEKALKFIRTTATTTGLKVTAHLDTTYYPTGVEVSKQELSQPSIRRNASGQNGITRSRRRCEVALGRLSRLDASKRSHSSRFVAASA
jgi:hypothetical protein